MAGNLTRVRQTSGIWNSWQKNWSCHEKLFLLSTCFERTLVLVAQYLILCIFGALHCIIILAHSLCHTPLYFCYFFTAHCHIVCDQVTSLAVVDAFITRIKEVNSLLNTVVANRFEDARKEAAEVDRVLDSDNLPEEFSEQNAPYLGVPVTTKESVFVTGICWLLVTTFSTA